MEHSPQLQRRSGVWLVAFGGMRPLVHRLELVDGDVGVARGGENGVMTQNLLHFQQVDPGLDQVGCIAVAKTVGRDLFFSPQSMAT